MYDLEQKALFNFYEEITENSTEEVTYRNLFYELAEWCGSDSFGEWCEWHIRCHDLGEHLGLEEEEEEEEEEDTAL